MAARGEGHEQWAGGWVCHWHAASFEQHEATNNDDCCPWCGREVDIDE